MSQMPQMSQIYIIILKQLRHLRHLSAFSSDGHNIFFFGRKDIVDFFDIIIR